MNQENLDQLAAHLEALGCGPSIRQRLAAFACFGPATFEIMHTTPLTEGGCDIFIHCSKGDQGLYDALYYTAVLKRRPAVPEGMEGLDQSLGAVNWERLLAAREHVMEGSDADAVNAAQLIRQLQEVDASGVVRFWHWAGTVLENAIPNLAQLKSQHELSQRFYLMPDQAPIRFDEAQRFLQSRWMEKRINADRKLLVKNDRTETANTGAKGGKLLTKRTKANRKSGLFNR